MEVFTPSPRGGRGGGRKCRQAGRLGQINSFLGAPREKMMMAISSSSVFQNT